MPTDAFFDHVTPTRTSYAEIRYSRVCDGCVIRVDDAKPEFFKAVADEVEAHANQRIAAWTKQGFKPAKKAMLPEIQTPTVIEQITGLNVPARYSKFLDTGAHRKKSKTVLYGGVLPAAGNVTGVPGFAGGVPIVFDDPAIPFWLAAFGWSKQAPTAIPIALFEDSRVMAIDSKTGKVFAYDNSATEPLVLVSKTLDDLLKQVGR